MADFPTVLVSAADLHSLRPDDRSTVEKWCETEAASGRVIMFDSGGYEASWKEWPDWSQQALSAVSEVDVSIRLALDTCWRDGEDIQGAVMRASESYAALETYKGLVVPVLRAPLAQLIDLVQGVAESLDCAMVAVAERDLGWGILDRCSAIAKLRAVLDAVLPDCFLHILGAGNPHDVLAYWLSGADSFDGLEWCRAVIDPRNQGMLCLSQWQIVAALSAVGAEAEQLPYFHSMALSNLIELHRWTSTLAQSSRDEGLVLARETLDPAIAAHVAALTST